MMNLNIKTLILLTLHVVISKSAKNNVSPAYEVNEQARTEEKKPPNIPEALPYGNPLAGNLLQNAKLHAQNQQAMFQAERVRQHRAQTQRWAKEHQPNDSYMKAYRETQESHQLALEQEQSKLNDKKLMFPTNKENIKRMKIPELTKITKEDAVTKPQKRRNHRSYGSIEYKRYFQPATHQNVHVSSGPDYNEGVAINPNGITYLNAKQPNKLYSEAVETKIQYAYPKQYNQIHYASAQDISSLNALLNKSPQDQLTELNAMTHTEEETKDTLETPLNFYVYLKQPKSTEHYKQTYTEIPQDYANAYTEKIQVKDHTPINEYIDDIEDPNKSTTIKAFGLQNILTTQEPDEDSSTRSYLNAVTQPIDYHSTIQVEEENPNTYQTLKEEQPVYLTEDIKNDDPKGVYLHQDDQPKGVQHLNQNGQEVSAYNDLNLQYASNYKFGYRVRDELSGNYFGHQEAKKDGQTKGHYHVLLPDGRMQKVKYYAGPEGFHADISYDHMK